MLTLSFATGTEPDKWFQRFQQRTNHGGLSTHPAADPLAEVLADQVQLGLIRLPDSRIDDSLHLVRLYEEQLGIALPKDHTLTLLEKVVPTDIEGELINHSASTTGYIDPEDIRQHLSLVAANVGLVIAPRPLVKALSGKQIQHRDFIDPNIAPTTIALVWKKTNDTESIQDFVGIAKGRTPNTSRGAVVKKTATEKAQAKRVRREQRTGVHKSKRRGRRR